MPHVQVSTGGQLDTEPAGGRRSLLSFIEALQSGNGSIHFIPMRSACYDKNADQRQTVFDTTGILFEFVGLPFKANFSITIHSLDVRAVRLSA